MPEPLYRAKDNIVWKRPVKTENPDGTSNYTLGFPVCEAADGIAAEDIAKALNVAAGVEED